MGELVDRDQEHLRLLMLGYYINAGFCGFFSLFSLVYMAIGVLAASGALSGRSSSSDNPRVVGLIFLGIGFLFLAMALGGAWLNYFTARSLKLHRHRTFCLIIGGLSCLQMPWGTVIGVCTILVLSRPSVRMLFEPRGPFSGSPPMPPPPLPTP